MAGNVARDVQSVSPTRRAQKDRPRQPTDQVGHLFSHPPDGRDHAAEDSRNPERVFAILFTCDWRYR